MEAESNGIHLCLGCKKTVAGPENYKMHRNKICNSYKKSLTNLLASNWRKPIVCHKNDKSLCGLKLQNESTFPKKFMWDTYSLGTEKSYKLVSPSMLAHSLVMDGRQSHEIVLGEQDTNFSNGTKSHETRTYSHPRTFCTEVKSRYLSNPYDGILLKTNSRSSLHINECYSMEKKKRITVANCNLKNNIPRVHSEQTSKDLKCEPCGKIFNTKMEVMVHVFSLEHREKFDNIERWYESVFCHQESLIYSSLFQCLICKYYFNNHEEFVAHLKSRCHSQTVTNLNLSILCASCEFECIANVELLNHVVSKEHQQIVHCKSQHHPIVITKTNENACQYCNSNCQLMEMHKDQQNVTIASEKQDNIISNCNSINCEVQDDQIILPQTSKDLKCEPCGKIFNTKMEVMVHVFSLEHREKFDNIERWYESVFCHQESLIYSSLFQCSICKYYFNNHEEFVAHLKSRCHSQTVTNLNLSILCASCEFECIANVELLNHVVSKEHQQIVRCKSQHHPIVITKTNENACQYCNSNCQLMEMHKNQQNVTIASEKQGNIISNCNSMNCEVQGDQIILPQTSKDLKCEPCGKIFNTKMEVMVHVFSLEHREKFDNIERWYESVFCHQESLIYSSLFQCSICKYYFNNHEEFVAHLKSRCHSQTVTNLNLSILCASCEFECIANVELLNHVVSKEHQQIVRCKSQHHPIVITKTNENACQYCNSNCQLMEMHKDQQNVTIASEKQDNIISNCNSINCEVPEKSFQTSRLSNEIVTSNTVFLCQQCNKLFTHVGDFKTHIDLNHSKKCQSRDSFNTSPLISKQLCDHIYWRRHKQKPLTQKNSKRIKSCKNEQHMPYSCEMLNRDTGFQVGIKIPTQAKEQCNKDASKKYNCSYCNKSFDSKSTLKFHIFTHTGEKPYKCDMCSKAFAQSSQRVSHRRSHFGVKHLKCDKCDYRTHKKSTLLKHKQIHGVNRTRNFLCDICGNAYFDKLYLKRHMQYHNGCIHKCSFPGCSRAFSTPCELTYHVRIHTNEKPYLCDVCGKSLRTSTLLKFHQLKHAEHWNYKCPYCSYATNFLARLQKHVLKTDRHSRELVFPCKFCSFSGNGLKEYRDHLLLNHSENFPNGRKQIDSMLISGVHFEDIPEKTTKSKYNVTNKKSSEFHNRKLKKKMNLQNNILPNVEKTVHSGSSKRKNKAFTSVTKIPAIPSIDRNAENRAEEMVTEHSECTIYIEIPTTEICETVELSSEIDDKQSDNEILQAMSAIQ